MHVQYCNFYKIQSYNNVDKTDSIDLRLNRSIDYFLVNLAYYEIMLVRYAPFVPISG